MLFDLIMKRGIGKKLSQIDMVGGRVLSGGGKLADIAAHQNVFLEIECKRESARAAARLAAASRYPFAQ